MKKSIFITGVAGSGKTTISRALTTMGYKALDIETDEHGLFRMVRKDTGGPYTDYDNADIEKVNNASWLCDISKLKELLNSQKEEIDLCWGIGNNEDIMSLFDVSILLRASPDTINKRLTTREGTDDFANTEEGRQRVLSWKDEFEERMIRNEMIVVDANPDAEEVAREIVKLVS